MRIHYIDPALYGQNGHHLQWLERIVPELTGRGHEVRTYMHHQAKPEAMKAASRHAPALPYFVSQPYLLPEKVDPVCGELSLFMQDMHHLPAALRGLPEADAWVWPTLFESHLPAIAAAGVGVPVGACIHWAPDRMAHIGPAMWRYGALNAAKAGLNLRICAGVDELVPLYIPLLGQALPVLPIPVDAGAPASTGSRLETIGFFGHQSDRKGVRLLPELVERLLKQGYKVVLQDSSGRAVSSHPRLQVLGYVPSLPDAMAACDLVVAPYDPRYYRYMASGIVWEALSRGVPVVAPADTSPARFVERLGAGTTFRSYDVAGIFAAIDQAREHYAVLRQAAHRACETWPQQHGVAHYVTALLKGIAPEPMR